MNAWNLLALLASVCIVTAQDQGDIGLDIFGQPCEHECKPRTYSGDYDLDYFGCGGDTEDQDWTVCSLPNKDWRGKDCGTCNEEKDGDWRYFQCTLTDGSGTKSDCSPTKELVEKLCSSGEPYYNYVLQLQFLCTAL